MNWNEALATCASECDSFYLYSEGGLRRRGEALKKAFPGAEVLYSIKCNPHPRILKIMAELGLGFDAAGAGEGPERRRQSLPYLLLRSGKKPWGYRLSHRALRHHG